MQGCGPTYYAPEHGVLYHNDGHGKFHDITKISGASKVSGNALGVCFADYDGSGRQSIAIANDMRPGDLLKNGISGLRNVSVESGIITDTVHPVAGMGIDWGDYDNDGQPDLFLTAFSGQNKPVLHNCGNGTFENQSDKLGLDKPANQALTFGAKWIDYDNDGWLDLILANGGVYENAGTAQYLEPSSLFHNNHGRHLEDMSLLAGPDLTKLILGRGLAIGDYDNDGLVDVLVANSEGLPVLLHNASANTGHWLSITLVGTKSNRDGIGATVTVTAGKLTQVRLCHTDGSYLSSSDKRVHVGMGNHLVADSLMIHWPSGEIQSLRDVRCDRQITLTEGK